MKLFCIPHAGGMTSSYFYLKEYLHNKVRLCPVELSGHGTRCQDKLYSSFDEAVSDVFRYISCNVANDEDYAILGHSMGAWIAYEVYCKLVNSQFKLPVHLFFFRR